MVKDLIKPLNIQYCLALATFTCSSAKNKSKIKHLGDVIQMYKIK